MFSYEVITKCRNCESTNLRTLYDMGMHYVVAFPEADVLPEWVNGKVEDRIPLSVVGCDDCEYIQSGQNVDPDRLYRHFWYKSGINEGMRQILRNIVYDAINRVGAQDIDAVLDIASNDGTLLSFYPKTTTKVGVDPAKNLQAEAKKVSGSEHIIAEYFDIDLIDDLLSIAPDGFKIITAIAMFYDLKDPKPFMEAVRTLLRKDGVFIIQMNYVLSMIDTLAVDNIAHEHLGYYSLRALMNLCKACGMKVLDAETNGVNGGSIKVTIGRWDTVYPENTPALEELLETEAAAELMNIETWQAFGRQVRNVIARVSKYILDAVDRGEKVYLYGASTRGSTLMQLLPDKVIKNIQGAAERNPEKVGRYMVGTWIPIVGEDEARAKVDVFLVLPWHFGINIMAREMDAMNLGAKFLFPLPEPVVFSAEALIKS